MDWDWGSESGLILVGVGCPKNGIIRGTAMAEMKLEKSW